jgi:hypothetical protein
VVGDGEGIAVAAVAAGIAHAVFVLADWWRPQLLILHHLLHVQWHEVAVLFL